MDWMRPGEYKGSSYNDAGLHYKFHSKPSLYGSLDKPVPNGVHQYGLGDCWFLAAVSALAEQPERIERIIWNEKYDENGAFRFYFWLTNKWYPINIDDRLPSKESDEDEPKIRPWATWPSSNGAWWMPLLEKAFTKFNLNYDRISGGDGLEALRTLTAMPARQM